MLQRLVRLLTIGALVLLVILYTYAQYVQFGISYKPNIPVPPIMGYDAKQKWESLTLSIKEFDLYCDNYIDLLGKVPIADLTEQTRIIKANKPAGLSTKISNDLNSLKSFKELPELSDPNDFETIKKYVSDMGDAGGAVDSWYPESLSDYKTWLQSIDDSRYSAEQSTGGLPKDYNNRYYKRALDQTKVMDSLSSEIQRAGSDISTRSQSLLLSIISG